MLASISPFGERARGNRWAVTAVAYATASLAAAAGVGAVLGLAGSALEAHVRLAVLAAAALVAALVDVVAPDRIPTSRRQVDENWVGRYRGWVYGAGFGGQLGLGVVTVITTATVYAWLLACLAAGGTAAGALVGAMFGFGRAVPILFVARAHSPARLRVALRRMATAARPVRVVAAVATAGVGAAAIGLGLL